MVWHVVAKFSRSFEFVAFVFTKIFYLNLTNIISNRAATNIQFVQIFIRILVFG